MPGTYNTTQKNLLVASDHAQQAVRRLEYAFNADERRDAPELRPHLKNLVDRQFAVTEAIHQLRQRYDDGEFDKPELNFTPVRAADPDVILVDIMSAARSHSHNLTQLYHQLEHVVSPRVLDELRLVNEFLSDLASPTTELLPLFSKPPTDAT